MKLGKVMYQKDENGTIISPGKFEGENQETVDYWEKTMNGMADEEITDINGTQYSIFYVSDNSNIVIHCDDNGFIYKSFLNKQEKNKLVSEIINAHLMEEYMDADIYGDRINLLPEVINHGNK